MSVKLEPGANEEWGADAVNEAMVEYIVMIQVAVDQRLAALRDQYLAQLKQDRALWEGRIAELEARVGRVEGR